MTPDKIKMILHEAGGIEKYEACLLEAARVWSELPDHVLAGLLASIGRFTQNDDEGKSLINILGLFAFIGFIRTARLAACEQEFIEDRSEGTPDTAEAFDKLRQAHVDAGSPLDGVDPLASRSGEPWQILAADWMENVAKIQGAEGLTGEPEIEWLRRLATVLRKEPEYLAKKKAADMADDVIRGA